MDTGEGCVIGGHAVVLQAGYHLHVGFGDVVLGEGHSELLGAVVAVVEEDHGVAFLDCSVDSRVVDGLDEFVGHVLVIAFLHGLGHVSGLLAFAFNQ